MAYKILTVCLGNICRSPTAQACLENAFAKAGLSDLVMIDSAGTAAYHLGKAPDSRAIEHGEHRGLALAHQRARQVSAPDFAEFDLILAMDAANLETLKAMGAGDNCQLFRAFTEQPGDVPDPYYGGADGFETVLDLCMTASDGVVAYVSGELKHEA